jgi:hypothetical protein
MKKKRKGEPETNKQRQHATVSFPRLIDLHWIFIINSST